MLHPALRSRLSRSTALFVSVLLCSGLVSRGEPRTARLPPNRVCNKQLSQIDSTELFAYISVAELQELLYSGSTYGCTNAYALASGGRKQYFSPFSTLIATKLLHLVQTLLGQSTLYPRPCHITLCPPSDHRHVSKVAATQTLANI